MLGGCDKEMEPKIDEDEARAKCALKEEMTSPTKTNVSASSGESDEEPEWLAEAGRQLEQAQQPRGERSAAGRLTCRGAGAERMVSDVRDSGVRGMAFG